MKKEELLEIVEVVRKDLSSEDVLNILEFIDNNEWGVAFETLCTQIDENEIPITKEFFHRLEDYAKKIKLNDSTFNFLKDRVIK